jgi:hypothetical protein
MAPDTDASKLSSIKTELLVAWIFSILVVIGWVIAFLFYFVYVFIFIGLLGVFAGVFAIFGLVYGIFFLILMIPSFLVLQRTGRMKNAADRGDIGTLKSLNSVGWAVIGLIFTGVIPGVMLLIANGPINELGATGSGGGLGADSLDSLTKLKSLLDSGAITAAEYEDQKKRILSTM